MSSCSRPRRSPRSTVSAAAVAAPMSCPGLAEGDGPLPPGMNGPTTNAESVMTRARPPITSRQGTVPCQRVYQWFR